jgi:GTPase SAR1 family protein
MKTGQGFLLVFSITSLSSLTELAELREQIIRIKDDENVPIVIVGNKSDLEDDRVVSRARAFQVSQSWGNAPYYETSARRRGEHDNPFGSVNTDPTKQTSMRFSWTSADRSFGGTTVEHQKFDTKLILGARRDR